MAQKKVLLDKELRNRISQFQRIFDKADDALIIHAIDGSIMEINPSACKLFGKTRKELLEKNIAFIYCNNKHFSYDIILKRTKQCGHTKFETEIQKPDQTILFVEISSIIADTQMGIVYCIICDISQRKRIEDALRASEQQYKNLIYSQGEGIAYIDQNERFFFSNPAADKIFGVKTGQLVGRNLREFVDQETFTFLQKQTEIRKTGEKSVYEIKVTRPDKNVCDLLITSTPRIGHDKVFLGAFVVIRDITEYKNAARALKESESSLKKAQELAHVGSWEWNLKTNLFTFSEELSRIYGIPMDQPVVPMDMIINEIIHPDDRVRVRNAAFGIAEHLGADLLEYRIIRSNGEVRTLLSTQPEARRFDKSGNPEVVMGAIQDITERKQAEAALKEHEEKINAQYQGIPVPTYTWQKNDNDFVLINYNTAASKITQGKIAELIGIKATQLYPNQPEIIKDLNDCYTKKNIINKEMFYKLKTTGEEKYLVVSYSFVPPDLIIVHTVDITDRKNAELSLRDSEEKFRKITESAKDAIIITDYKDRISYWNKAATTIFGYSEKEALGEKLHKLLASEVYQKDIIRGFKNFQKTGEGPAIGKTLGLEGKNRDGTIFPVELSLSAVKLKNKWHAIGIVRDVTERKHMAELLHETEKFAATGRMAARIAHEINNPLGGIKNSFLLIKDAIPHTHPYFDYVERIEKEINRIARIVRQMLELYRPNHEVAKEFNVETCIRDIVTLLQVGGDTNSVSIELIPQKNPVKVILPEDLLRQVLYNVIQNAVEASPPDSIVRINFEIINSNLLIEITDQGKGIKDDMYPKVYEPFFTTKSDAKTGGLGLGLSISKSIVETLKGSMEFESQLGKGTKFRISIPLTPQVN